MIELESESLVELPTRLLTDVISQFSPIVNVNPQLALAFNIAVLNAGSVDQSAEASNNSCVNFLADGDQKNDCSGT